jgi:indole-3-acetate monooxygenase
MDGAAPRMVGGMPQIVAAIMPIENVEIVDTWYGLGLRGSDSNDIAVRDLFVPNAYTCPLVPTFEPNEHYRAPLYRMPVMGAIVLGPFGPIGIALGRNAIEEVRALSSKRMPMASQVPLRDRGAAQARLGRAEGMLRAARALMYETMSEVWERTRAGAQVPTQLRSDLLLAATHAAQTGVEVTDMMYASAGSSAVYVGHPLERLQRDAQVLRQHGFVCAARYETVAQVELGLDPDLPLVHF